MIEIKMATKAKKTEAQIILFSKLTDIPSSLLNEEIKKRLKEAEINKPFSYFDGGKYYSFQICQANNDWKNLEQLRKNGATLTKELNSLNLSQLLLSDYSVNAPAVKALCEGIVLSSYHFNKYKTEQKKSKTLEFSVESSSITAADLVEWNALLAAVCKARDLVNEPNSFLTAPQLSEEFEKLAKEVGVKIDVWTEAKIRAQKFGGLLGVNSGSSIPPTFNILEWNPKKAKNKKPVILVGKGVVYDTGGMSLSTLR